MRPALLFALCLSLACQNAGSSRASRMPDLARPCVQASTQDACALAIASAAEQGDTATVGQLLTLAADWLPQPQAVPVARAAAWLAPAAWAPQHVLDTLANQPPPTDPLPPKGHVLVLGNARVTASPKTSVDLSVPSGQGPFAGRQLAMTLALATGSPAVAWEHNSQTHLIASAPLFERIAKVPVFFEPSASASAALCGKADHALRQGDRTQAYLLLGDAVESLPEDAAACRTLGPLHYLRWTLSGPAYAGVGNAHLEDLRNGCLKTAAASEAELREYFHQLSTLQAHRGTESFALPREWLSADGRSTYLAHTDALAARWKDGRGDLLLALRDEMIARTETPRGACDTDFPSRTTKALDAAKRRLAAAGRDDLALPTLRTRFGDDGIVVEGVEDLTAWTAVPHRRWIRVPALTAALAGVEYASPSPKNAEVLAPICSAAHDAILAEITSDRRDGFHARNVVRMMALFRGAAVCGPPEKFSDVADAVLSRSSQGPDGKLGTLQALGLAALEIAVAALDKRIPSALMSGMALRDAMRRTRSSLGSTDEDVVLDASLGILLAGIDRYTAERADLARVIDGAIRRLDPIVPKAADPGSPALVGYAPAVHLIAHALLVAVESSDNPDRRDVAAQRLDRVVERDVSLFLQAQGVPQYAGAMGNVLRNLAGAVRAQGNAKEAGVMLSRAREAMRPGADERGWWSIGLNLARLVSLDLALHGSLHEGTKPSVEADMALCDRTLERLVDHAMRDFPERRDGLDALHLLPALHRATFAGLFLAEDDDARWAVALDAAGKASQPALERLALRNASAKEAGFLAVLMDALQLAHAGGGPRRLVDDKAARQRWATELSSRAKTYPPELAFVAEIAAGVGAHEAAPREATGHFRAAAELAANPRNVPYLPRLVEAAVLHHGGDTAGAASVVEEILAYGQKARTCGAPHEVDALLPYRAWAAEKLGKHKEADASLALFLQRTSLFSGQGKLQCRLRSDRPAIILTADAHQMMDRLFFRGEKPTGSFQTGVGFGGAHHEDRLFCTAFPVLGPRPDLQLATHLTRAAYALRASDDRAAHQALGQAVLIARRFLHGNDVTVGFSDRLTLDAAKEEAPLGQIAWGAAVARARGHVACADVIDQLVRVVDAKRESPLKTLLQDQPDAPSSLETLGFDAAGPWVRSAWGAKTQEDVRTMRGIPSGSGANALPSWAWVLLAAQVDRGATSPGRARLRTLRPAGQLERVLVDRVRARMEASEGRTVRPISLDDAKVLAEGGLHFELVSAVLDAVLQARATGKQADAGKLVDLALLAVSADQAPLARADLLAGVFRNWPQRADDLTWAEAMEQVHPSLGGTVPAPEEVDVLYAAVTRLGRHQAYSRMGKLLARLEVLMARALGQDHPSVIVFAAAQLAVRAAQGEAVDASTLLDRARKSGRVAPGVLAFLQAPSGARTKEAKALLGALPPL